MLFENVGKYLQNSEPFIVWEKKRRKCKTETCQRREMREKEREREHETEYLFVVFKLLSSYALKAFQFETRIQPNLQWHECRQHCTPCDRAQLNSIPHIQPEKRNDADIINMQNCDTYAPFLSPSTSLSFPFSNTYKEREWGKASSILPNYSLTMPTKNNINDIFAIPLKLFTFHWKNFVHNVRHMNSTWMCVCSTKSIPYIFISFLSFHIQPSPPLPPPPHPVDGKNSIKHIEWNVFRLAHIFRMRQHVRLRHRYNNNITHEYSWIQLEFSTAERTISYLSHAYSRRYRNWRFVITKFSHSNVCRLKFLDKSHYISESSCVYLIVISW